MTEFDPLLIARKFQNASRKEKVILLNLVRKTASQLSARGKSMFANRMAWTAAHLSVKAAEDNAPRCKYPYDDGRNGTSEEEYRRVKAAENNAPLHPFNDGRQNSELNLGQKPSV